MCQHFENLAFTCNFKNLAYFTKVQEQWIHVFAWLRLAGPSLEHELHSLSLPVPSWLAQDVRGSKRGRQKTNATDDEGLLDLLKNFALCYCAMSNRELLKGFKQINGKKKFLLLEQSFQMLCREQIYSDQSGSNKASKKAFEVFRVRCDCA